MGKKKGGGGNQKPAATGVNGGINLDPSQMGKDGKPFSEHMAEGAVTAVTMLAATAVMYFVNPVIRGFVNIFTPLPKLDAPASGGAEATKPAFADVLSYAYKSVESTGSDDVKTVTDEVIKHNSECGPHRKMVEGAVKKALSEPKD